MQVVKIEVNFAIPVELTDRDMMLIDRIVNDAARRTETAEIVHWAAHVGCKPNYSKADCRFLGKVPADDAPESGEPTYEDDVFYIETCCRERFESEPFKPQH
jgi:hypothetical protein